MDDGEALLQAIIAHPDDDTPRLAYADWLDENGDPTRAEFIRGQIEATRLGPGNPAGASIRVRVVELAERYGKRWCEGCKAILVRGFPVAACYHDLNEVCRGKDRLFAQHPIRVVYADEYYRSKVDEAEVTSSPLFARFTGLGSDNRGWGGDRVARALTNPHLANLQMIDFRNGSYNRAAGAMGIAAATHFSKLVVLDLSGNAVGDEGVEALAGAAQFASLRSLRLGRGDSDWSNEFTAAGAEALARSKCFISLTQLVLDGNEIADAGLDHLLRAEWFANLTELNLADTWLGEGSLIAIARSHRLSNLRRLDVSGNGVTEAVAHEFLRTDSLPNLLELHLVNGSPLEEHLSEGTQTALCDRFGSEVIFEGRHAPMAICTEDKVRERMQDSILLHPTPPDDCEVV